MEPLESYLTKEGWRSDWQKTKEDFKKGKIWLATLGLIGTGITFVGCGKSEIPSEWYIYKGQIPCYNVRISVTENWRYKEYYQTYVLLETINKNTHPNIIHGSDYNSDGRWDMITIDDDSKIVDGKFVGARYVAFGKDGKQFFGQILNKLTPGEITQAKALLDNAVVAVENENYRVYTK